MNTATTDNWVTHSGIDFADQNIKAYHIDTRDFHTITKAEIGLHKDHNKRNFEDIEFDKIKKYPERFFFTPEKVQEIVEDLYKRSHGPGQWRHLQLKDHKERTGWDLKYLRIFRTEYGMIICSNQYYVLSIDVLQSEVRTEYLNHH